MSRGVSLFIVSLVVAAVVIMCVPTATLAQAPKYKEGQWVSFSGTGYRGFGCIWLKGIRSKLDSNFWKQCSVYCYFEEVRIDSEKLGAYYWVELFDYPVKEPTDRVLALESDLRPTNEPWWINYEPPPSPPSYNPLTIEPLYPSLSSTYYTAVSGDTAWGIAVKNGISLNCLCKANCVPLEEADLLKVGQLVYIPPVSWCKGLGY